MQHYQHFFGVDVSKKTVDITYLEELGSQHRQFLNDPSGMKELLGWLNNLKVDYASSLFCMEATGLYCFTLTEFLTSHHIAVWVEHAAQIKGSAPLQRGKSDKIDSGRIALYAKKNLDRLRLWQPMPLTLQKIKHLATLRDRLVDTKSRLLVPIEEFEQTGNLQMARLLKKSIKASLSALDKDLKHLEHTIIEIVNSDDNLKQLYGLITSVVGIGFVTAINLMIHTQAFTVLKDQRKLACYCGVAPFEHTSGSSIRGKTRVHHMANKKLKSNLHMAAISAVQLDGELKDYYHRKVAEGKAKMSVLNAVKNKLLARVVAVVKKQQPYRKRLTEEHLILS